MAVEPENTTDHPRNVAYRCSCGADVLLPAGGVGECSACKRRITLNRLDASQTVSFCSDVGSGTSFHLEDGPDRSGESLGHFRLMSKLGYGGMGAVYRALDESLHRFVAVKVIRADGLDASTADTHVAKLLDEAVAQARLNHPNVVTVYYVGREGEEPFLAMELLPGPTLAQVIYEEPLPYKDVIRYARQVCSALSQANRLGLIHGDIKPSNLILAGDQTVKLGDFGLAKTERSIPSKGISGTISYMAPELVTGSQPSAQSDIYSLGVTLFELAFGRRPYAVVGTTLREQITSQKKAEIEFPEKWPSSVPERFRQVLETMLARDPEERYASFDELDKALRVHAPVGVTNASLVARAFALFVDYVVLTILLLPFIAVGQLANQGIVPMWVGNLSLLAPIVPALATIFDQRGWRTLGRYLLQLRLVDRHGLILSRKRRGIRSLIRLMPIWILSISTAFDWLGFYTAALLIAPIDEIVLLLDILPVLGRNRQAIHDRIAGSHVVLDFKQAEN